MQTHFTPDQLKNPTISEADSILRKCVHCGFCTATCPTYVLTGDERDSPRGRIYMIKEMLEQEAIPAATVPHIDRCLTCLSCMTTCPAGVDYMHLVEIARNRITQLHPRPLIEKLTRKFLAGLLTRPRLFRLSLIAGFLAKPLLPMLARLDIKMLRGILPMIPDRLSSPDAKTRPGVFSPSKHTPQHKAKGRVALLPGCAQQVIGTQINQAAIELLNCLEVEVEVIETDCCGALPQHLGEEDHANRLAQSTATALHKAHMQAPFDALVVTASGCGTTLKDYGHQLPDHAGAALTSHLSQDFSEYISDYIDRYGPLPIKEKGMHHGLTVAWHPACSLQHGQKIRTQPVELLKAAGFVVKTPDEPHLCCGSAGVYNILQPEIANALKKRKQDSLQRTGAVMAAMSNLGCMKQLDQANLPTYHLAELLNWACGGEAPASFK